MSAPEGQIEGSFMEPLRNLHGYMEEPLEDPSLLPLREPSRLGSLPLEGSSRAPSNRPSLPPPPDHGGFVREPSSRTVRERWRKQPKNAQETLRKLPNLFPIAIARTPPTRKIAIERALCRSARRLSPGLSPGTEGNL